MSRTTNRIFFLLLASMVSTVFLAGWASTASACKCKDKGAWAEVSAKAPYVVQGKFVRVEHSDMGSLIVFEVGKVLKGKISQKTIRILGSRGKDCRRTPAHFDLGAQVRIALDEDPAAGPQSMTTCVENIVEASAAAGVLPPGWPWALLRVPGKPLLELEGGPSPTKAKLQSRGVVQWRGFIAEEPTVWLFVFAFSNQAAALAAQPELTGQWSHPDGPPFHGDSVVNGAYLLVAAFPSSKPPSPEMIQARDAFVQAFAGAE